MCAQLIIIECIPKSENANEGDIVFEFAKMTREADWLYLIRRKSKGELIRYLKTKKDLEDYDYVHLSGHGDADSCTFKTPNGELRSEDFPEECFFDQTVTLNACELGRKSFIEPFMDQTGAKYVIAPQREVEFVDAALWFLNFYYHVLHLDISPVYAYDRVCRAFPNVKGAFQFWSQ